MFLNVKRIYQAFGWAREMGIPPRFWQTYISKQLPGRAAICNESWQRLNTQWEKYLWDDGEIAEMMSTEFPEETGKVFREFPLGVMRADMWRYAVLAKFGGLYADVDCRCVQSINEWDLGKVGCLASRGKKWLLICLENDAHFCNWTFAGVAGHPAFERVIALIVERAQAGIDFSNEHFVHEHTGPSVWTDAIREVLRMENYSPGEIYRSEELREAAKERGIIILDYNAFSRRFCCNEFGSVSYGDSWVSWTDQREDILNRQLQFEEEDEVV